MTFVIKPCGPKFVHLCHIFFKVDIPQFWTRSTTNNWLWPSSYYSQRPPLYPSLHAYLTQKMGDSIWRCRVIATMKIWKWFFCNTLYITKFLLNFNSCCPTLDWYLDPEIDPPTYALRLLKNVFAVYFWWSALAPTQSDWYKEAIKIMIVILFLSMFVLNKA